MLKLPLILVNLDQQKVCDALTIKKVLGPSPFEMNQSQGSN